VHDPLSVVDLVHDEFRQRDESGYDVSGIAADLAATAENDRGRLEAQYLELINTEQRSDWAYQESDSVDQILQAMPTVRGLPAVAPPSTGSGRISAAGGRPSTSSGCILGAGEFTATVGLTVQGGWDTDSNAATAGSVVGTVLGAAKLPRHFIEPLQDRTRSAVFGYDNSRISELAGRTTTLTEGRLGLLQQVQKARVP